MESSLLNQFVLFFTPEQAKCYIHGPHSVSFNYFEDLICMTLRRNE